MRDAHLKPVCNHCNVALIEDRRHAGEPRASCPNCGLDFGPMSEVRERMSYKQDEAFRDMYSWRAEPADAEMI